MRVASDSPPDGSNGDMRPQAAQAWFPIGNLAEHPFKKVPGSSRNVAVSQPFSPGATTIGEKI
jgi:hypothetical protein